MESVLSRSNLLSSRAILEKYSAFLKQTNHTAKQIEIMNDVYAYMKQIAPSMYSGIEMNSTYRSLIDEVHHLEYGLNKESILDVKPVFDSTSITGHLKSCDEVSKIEDKLKSIVKTIRELIFLQLRKEKKETLQQFSSYDLTGYCFTCSVLIERFCKVNNLKYKSFHLEPGFVVGSLLFSRFKKHFVSFVYSKEELYLVDISYSQFFWLKNNLIEKLGVPLLSGCSVGVFMTMTEERKKVAETLLRDGFIKVTPQVLKAYMDGFALSYRNGLAYEGTVSPSYTTNYTANDYLHFLYREDNQLNHERDYTLGIQKRPLSRF